jgi:hypothetical protein
MGRHEERCVAGGAGWVVDMGVDGVACGKRAGDLPRRVLVGSQVFALADHAKRCHAPHLHRLRPSPIPRRSPLLRQKNNTSLLFDLGPEILTSEEAYVECLVLSVGECSSRNGTSVYAYVSSGTVCETTKEPETQKEPEPRNKHPKSVERSILYRCGVLGAKQLNNNRRESCDVSMPDQLLGIEPSAELPHTEAYKISISYYVT